MKNSTLPAAPASLIASYRDLLTQAIEAQPDLGIIALTRTLDADDAVRLHEGTLALAAKLSSLLDEEQEVLGAFLRALAEVYHLPELTLAQGCVLLDFLTHEAAVTTVRQHGLPLILYPNGGLWTLLTGYPTLWLAGPWCVLNGKAHLKTPHLEAAIVLARQLRAKKAKRKAKSQPGSCDQPPL